MKDNTMSLTIGIDLGDKSHQVCVLNHRGMVELNNRIINNLETVKSFFSLYKGATIAMEAGSQSLWMSHLLDEMGLHVLVGNPRRLRMIWNNDRKADVQDAEMLARIARFDPKLLSPIHHRSIYAQHDLNQIKARDMLVRTRSNMINFVKGVLKQYGLRIPTCSAESLHKRAVEVIPDELKPSLDPMLELLDKLTVEIRQYDKKIARLCQRYPETKAVSQIKGVGPITSLAFVLILENPDRFRKSRDVGPFLGLVPRRDQSGVTDKQLRITKAGNPYLRRLLVGSAQYILGPFGEDCDLRRFGERIAERGGKNAKRRAIVAVARRLAVKMHALWKSGQEYEPLKLNTKQLSA
jgi:transposase